MTGRDAVDAVVVGSGPNGLAAAITLAQANLSVHVIEAHPVVGGGVRSFELTLPGFIHDTCSAVYPLGVGAPFVPSLSLGDQGLEWVHPLAPLAHPFDDGSSALLERSFDATAATLGADGEAHRHLFEPLARRYRALLHDILQPVHVPRHPFTLARFGWHAIRSARGLACAHFRGHAARGLFAGLAAHAVRPLESPTTASFGLVLGLLGHAVGWPIVRGGSQRLTTALVAHLRSLGGTIETGRRVTSLDALPRAAVVMLDTSPRDLLRIADGRLPRRYRRALERFRHGPGAFKMDWALSEPIPWRSPAVGRAGTVHLGGTFDEIAEAEAATVRGDHPARPFVLLGQPTLSDPTRAPANRHTAWGYCHVPNGSAADMTERIEAQVERFAPGFRDCILARHGSSAADMARDNPNYVGGDISGGANTPWQMVARPVLRLVPYATPLPGVYLCSSSTPPGGGVHGMCGYHAARAALAWLRSR